MRAIDADELYKSKFQLLPYTHITPSGVNTELYKRGWNDAIDAIVENAPTIEPECKKGETMGYDLYKVTTGNVDVARYMPLNSALILVKALMTEYYNEPELDYTIKRERRKENA